MLVGFLKTIMYCYLLCDFPDTHTARGRERDSLSFAYFKSFAENIIAPDFERE